MSDNILPLDGMQKMLIAVKAEVSYRTVDRYLTGRPLRSVTRRRVERAMRKLGFAVREAAAA